MGNLSQVVTKHTALSDDFPYLSRGKKRDEFSYFLVAQRLENIEKIVRRVNARLYEGQREAIGENILILRREEVEYFVDVGSIGKEISEKAVPEHIKYDTFSFSEDPFEDTS